MRTPGNGDYGVRDVNSNSYQEPESGIPSYTTRGHSSLSRNGDVGMSQNSAARSTANQECPTGHGYQYLEGVHSKRNETSTSLRGCPQLDMGNGFNTSPEGRHHPSSALPRNYCIESRSHPSGRLGLKYGQDRERMKEELSNLNSMARTGSGILPGGIVQDRGAPMSHLLWRGTRSDTNSSIRQPLEYSSTRSETTLTPARMNENTRVSSLISDAEAVTNRVRNDLSEFDNQYQERIDSFTRPTASWNSVGIGGHGDGRMTISELEKERQLSGAKRMKQNVYRADLERQVEQKNRRRMDEELQLNSHPLGKSYEHPDPTFWQSSMKARANCPEDIFPQHRLLVQNSSTRIGQYEVPCKRVTKAITNLENSRINPDTYQSQIHSKNMAEEDGDNGIRNQNPNTTFPSQQHLSNMSANNFRAHSSQSDKRDETPRGYSSSQGFPTKIPSNMQSMQNFTHQRRPTLPPQQPVFYGPPIRSQNLPPSYYGHPVQPPMPVPVPVPYFGPHGPYPFQQMPYPMPNFQYQHQQQFPLAPPNQQVYPSVPVNQFPQYSREMHAEHKTPEQQRRFDLDEIEEKVSQMQKHLGQEEETENEMNNSDKTGGNSNSLKPSKSTYSNLDRLAEFVESKLARNDVDFDELRENIFGRPNNWKTTDTAIDLKPIKDMINRAELTEQIKINKRKKAIQAAKEQEEEERLDRRIDEYNHIQKVREEVVESNKYEIMKNQCRNKKAVSHHFILEQKLQGNKLQNSRPNNVPPKTSSRKLKDHDEIPNRRVPEDPERTLARKLRHRSRSEGRFRNENEDYFAAGDQSHFQSNNSNEDSEYSYAQFMEAYNRTRPPSPPIPTLQTKSNDDTLKKKLKFKEFSKPQLSPSISRAPDLRARIDAEKGLKNKISASSF